MKVCAREARIGKGERRQANKAEQVRITVSLVGTGVWGHATSLWGREYNGAKIVEGDVPG